MGSGLDVDGEYESLSGNKRSLLQRFKYPIIAFVVVLVALAIVFTVIWSARLKDKKESNEWENQIKTSDIMGHLQQLQNIANANNGNRAASTSGYEASIDYVVGKLQKNTDYYVEVQNFTYTTVSVVSASNLTIYNSMKDATLVYGPDFSVLGGNNGKSTITNVTVTVADGYGCDISQYGNVLPNTIALVKRGNCSFVDKARVAASKNPAAIVFYNEGNTPDRMGSFSAAVGEISVPVLGTSYSSGLYMIGSSISFTTDLQVQIKDTKNIIADTKAGRADRVVVVGSHLDSVPAGPGINDNGSGSALNLALALLLASGNHQKELKNKIRFAWFGAEELGLLGSEFYVSNLNKTNPAELANIAVNLNFDMIGSPNFIRGVYNGSSDTKTKGSAVVQDLFNAFYAKEGKPVVPTEFTGRSDYGPFLAAGIPAGGLFTGAEEVKSIELRRTFGGLAGASYDPCYHQACDTIDNINQDVVTDMSRGAAHVLQSLSTAEDLKAFLNPN